MSCSLAFLECFLVNDQVVWGGEPPTLLLGLGALSHIYFLGLVLSGHTSQRMYSFSRFCPMILWNLLESVVSPSFFITSNFIDLGIHLFMSLDCLYGYILK